MENKTLNDKLTEAISLVEDYYQKNEIDVTVEIHFVDNINRAWKDFTHNENVIKQYRKEDFTRYSGLCMPRENGIYHILIRSDYEDYLCTALHEATHAADYDRFRVEFNGGNDDIEQNSIYCSMGLYSEFHARCKAHRFFLQKMQYEMYDDNKQFLSIATWENTNIYTEVCNLMLQFKHGEIILNKFDYELMQFLGRVYSYDIKDLYALHCYNESITSLYRILVELDAEWSNVLFEELIDKLSELRAFIVYSREEDLCR